HSVLNHFAALRVDGMSDIGIELGTALRVADGPLFAQTSAALIAILSFEMVLRAALMAMAGELAAGHGDEGPVGAVDDLEVADDKAVIEGDGAEALQSIVGVHHELDSDLSDLHGNCLLVSWQSFVLAV